MIIGNSYAGVPYTGMRRAIDTPTFSAPRPDPAPAVADDTGSPGAVSTAFGRASVDFYPQAEKSRESGPSGTSEAVASKPASGRLDSEGLLMRQTARIIAAMATMSGTDDMAAYAQLGRGDAQTDAHRHVINAYRDASE